MQRSGELRMEMRSELIFLMLLLIVLVPDTWESFDKLAQKISRDYNEWEKVANKHVQADSACTAADVGVKLKISKIK